jgi:hypothetical protein
MIYQMQMVRVDDGDVLQPIGEAISDASVISFMNEFSLDGVINVEPVAGDADYRFLVTFSFDGSDAVGEAAYLTNFDPHHAFPYVPRSSAPLPEPQR